MTTLNSSQKYQVNQHTIENILNWVKSEEMAIPEIQRPFVWDKKKVTNLIDSLELMHTSRKIKNTRKN